MSKPFLIIASMLYSLTAASQSVGIGTNSPNASALLELKSDSKGFLPPRMTAEQKTKIPTPEKGLMIYLTDSVEGLYTYNGVGWVASSSTAGNYVDLTTNQTIDGTKSFNADIYANGLRLGKGLNSIATNTAVGAEVLGKNNTGDANTGTGYQALFLNDDGSGNTANGFASLFSNTQGNSNTAGGRASLYSNTTGSLNVATGDFSLYHNTIGFANTAIGHKAMYKNIDGAYNTAIGDSALHLNETGNVNTAIGALSLGYNTSGLANTTIGFQSLFSNNSGDYNTAHGYQALGNNTAGGFNIAIGAQAMIGNTTGSNNTAMGYLALSTNKTGTENTAIGYGANVGDGVWINATALGAYSEADCNNCLILGSINGLNGSKSNAAIGIGTPTPKTDLHIKQTNEGYPLFGGGLRLERVANTNHWDIGTDLGDDFAFTYNGLTKSYINEATGVYTVVSDLRMKKDIQAVSTVLPAIMQLQPKTYHYNDNQKTAMLSYGFIAQDVEKLFPDFVTTKGPENMKAIAYQNFGVVAIKAIQEQQQTIEEQENKMEKLLKMISVLEDRINTLEKSSKH